MHLDPSRPYLAQNHSSCGDPLPPFHPVRAVARNLARAYFRRRRASSTRIQFSAADGLLNGERSCCARAQLASRRCCELSCARSHSRASEYSITGDKPSRDRLSLMRATSRTANASPSVDISPSDQATAELGEAGDRPCCTRRPLIRATYLRWFFSSSHRLAAPGVAGERPCLPRSS